MQDRIDRIEAELRNVADQLRRLESRVSRMEDRRSAAASHPATESSRPPKHQAISVTAEAAASQSIAHVLGLFGRTFFILCGAFLLRSLTDAEILPLSLGVPLGLVYAAVWLLAADRAAHSNRTLSAILFGVAACVVAYPLLWEATNKFTVFSPATATAVLVVFTALALFVAWRRRIELLAWCVIFASLITDVAIVLVQGNWGSGTGVALILGAASVWLAHTRNWNAICWPVAVVVNVVPLMLFTVVIRSAQPGMPQGPNASLVLGLIGVYLGVYLVSFALRIFRSGHSPGVFEFTQTLACLVIAFAGVELITRVGDFNTTPLGWVALVLGTACYATGFTFVDRRLRLDRTFIYYTSLGLALVIWGLAVTAGDPVEVAILCGLGFVSAVVGRHFGRLPLRVHSAIFVATAAAVGALGAQAAHALVLPITETSQPVNGLTLLVAISAVVCYLVIGATTERDEVAWASRIPAVVLAFLSVVGTASVMLLISFDLLSRAGPLQPTTVATLRTSTLALLTIALAGLGTARHLLELTWLVYPLLVVTGAKILFEDLRLGNPLALAVSFAAFGVALMFAPRLLRRSKRSTTAGDSIV